MWLQAATQLREELQSKEKEHQLAVHTLKDQVITHTLIIKWGSSCRTPFFLGFVSDKRTMTFFRQHVGIHIV